MPRNRNETIVQLATRGMNPLSPVRPTRGFIGQALHFPEIEVDFSGILEISVMLGTRVAWNGFEHSPQAKFASKSMAFTAINTSEPHSLENRAFLL